MQCSKCKHEIPENELFCSYCGAKAQVYYVNGKAHQHQTKTSSGFLEFVRKMFRGFMTFALIAIIIICAILGVVLGENAGGDTGSILGLILGLIVGFIVVIFVGGSIATFIEIGENTRAIREDIAKIKNSKQIERSVT